MRSKAIHSPRTARIPWISQAMEANPFHDHDGAMRGSGGTVAGQFNHVPADSFYPANSEFMDDKDARHKSDSPADGNESDANDPFDLSTRFRRSSGSAGNGKRKLEEEEEEDKENEDDGEMQLVFGEARTSGVVKSGGRVTKKELQKQQNAAKKEAAQQLKEEESAAKRRVKEEAKKQKEKVEAEMKRAKEASKAAKAAERQGREAEKTSRYWDSDSVNSGPPSIEVLLDWLTTGENYRKYKGGAKVTNGKTKDAYCSEINTLMKSKGIHNRNPGMISTKIAELEKQYRVVLSFHCNTGQGMLDNYDLYTTAEDPELGYAEKLKEVDEEVKKRCHYYDELDPIMRDLPSSNALYTNEDGFRGSQPQSPADNASFFSDGIEPGTPNALTTTSRSSNAPKTPAQ
ncbi:hypothetical protein HDU80_001288, partial [Chytriomyces hyalinus]